FELGFGFQVGGGCVRWPRTGPQEKRQSGRCGGNVDSAHHIPKVSRPSSDRDRGGSGKLLFEPLTAGAAGCGGQGELVVLAQPCKVPRSGVAETLASITAPAGRAIAGLGAGGG